MKLNTFSCTYINAVKNRTVRSFNGWSKTYTTDLALYGGMGWKSCIVSTCLSIVRTWC